MAEDDWHVGSMRCLRKLSAMGRTIEANARAAGDAELVAEMHHRRAYIESAKREVAVGWLRARRHTPTHAARPRPRVRARRTRTAARRAGGCRSGCDPGDGSGSSEGDDDPPGRAARLTFRRFRRLTAGLSGAERLERFEALSPGAQDACWRDLARELEETRP